tara:strand:+ start:2807 stop:5074 length:2268 start_codon:yes stop_codon:yes gene_type:complete
VLNIRRDVKAQSPKKEGKIKIGKPKQVAAGITGVRKSFSIGISEAGLIRTMKTMRSVNKFDGYDCPGCAWPDPDGHRSSFEFCENGAKAFATEATKKRLTPSLLSSKSVQEWSNFSDMELDKLGRLTSPMVLRSDSNFYEEISWNDAFDMIAESVMNLNDPNEAVFYTSGRASNESAFLWGTLARQIGTNNLPDCSNMCHESSGVGLTSSIGIGKGTVTLDCFDKADLVIVIGQNPGTNHPRMLSALANTKRNGGSVISINPLLESGLNRFKHPQEIIRLLGRGTPIADAHFPVRIGGDQALLQGIAKVVLDNDGVNHSFVEEHTEGFDDWVEHISSVKWEDITKQSGIEKEHIIEIGNSVINANNMIICWAMGVTQHENAVATIQEITNLLLMGGHFGRPGAGACPVRGHSNVQGDRTVGINHNPPSSFLDACERETGITMPRDSGFDSVEFIQASRNDKVRLFMALGGNILSAMSDTEEVANSIRKIDLTVQISTKLNRSHLVTGKQALILPCLGRTEFDQSGFVTVENSMGVVHSSNGNLEPASKSLLSEVGIVSGIGYGIAGSDPFKWDEMSKDYDKIRDLIESVLPIFSNYNDRVRQNGGFYLPNGPRDGPTWDTPSSKAIFHSNSIPIRSIKENRFILMTIRSHDQYNTTIYGMDDRYRGIYNSRRIVMMNRLDMDDLAINEKDEVQITSHFMGRKIVSDNWKVVPYEIPRGNLAAYFPEANVLVPLESVAKGSNTPTSKWIEVSVKPQ